MFDWLRERVDSGKARLAREQSRRAREQGNSLLDQGRLQDALRAFSAAVDFDPTDGAARVSLGFALVSMDRCDVAAPHLQEAARLGPDDADAWYLLAQCQERASELGAASDSLGRALECRPDFELAARDMARVLVQQGRLDEAGAVLAQALQTHPHSADLRFYQGHLHLQRSDFSEASRCYAAAVDIEPGRAQLHMALADAHGKLGNWAGAKASSKRARELTPLDAQVHSRLGVAAARLGELDDALRSFARAIELDPRLADAHSNLSDTLRVQGDVPGALQSARAAIALAPEMAAAHNNLAAALAADQQDAAALQSFRRALELAPGDSSVLGNCGGALHRQGLVGEAIACYQRALDLDPSRLHIRSNLLFALTFAGDSSPADYLREARRYGEEASRRARPDLLPPLRTKDPARPLRVGLVSGDFRTHPVGFFLESVLAHMDPADIELVGYSTQPRTDDLTKRLQAFFADWQCLWGVPDADAARQVREDGIDLLVDLAGHSEHNRLPLFAWRAAPVQASWLGYFASTGMPEIDFLVVDPVSAPPELAHQFTETLWHLPHTRLCFTPPAGPDELSPGPTPALHRGAVTFGCFQSPSKITEQVVKAWARILERVPGSRLRLQTNLQGLKPDRLPSLLSDAGIALDRVGLVPATSRHDYLLAHREVDLLLDTFPYPGGTTTCEALWMGVPTVTLAGSTLLARQGASLMSCAGLPDWVANDVEGYVENAVGFASDITKLNALRQHLRPRVLSSPLFDAPRFAKDFSAALRSMWLARADT